jgi:tight adherence protein C
MIDFMITKMHDARFMTMLLSAIAASATAYTLIMPLFAGEGLAKRMKAVASERERLRQRERDRLAKSEKVSLRQTPKQLVSKVVEDFNLTKWLAQEAARDKLIMAGYRGHAPYVTFLFARAVTPIVLFIGAALYVFVITQMDKSLTVKLGICVGAAYLGLQAPMLFLKNAISKRQLSIKRAFPDALDLLLICIESGMSVEVAFRKVATEIATQSIALSEEFSLTTAELSYLQDRKVAYENLAKRTGLEGVKSVCLALMQSERYGTPLGQSLRVMAQENRDMRMNEAEKKAGRAAAEADRADDRVLPAVPVRRHSRTDLRQAADDALRQTARPTPRRLAVAGARGLLASPKLQ